MGRSITKICKISPINDKIDIYTKQQNQIEIIKIIMMIVTWIVDTYTRQIIHASKVINSQLQNSLTNNTDLLAKN